MVIFKGDDKWKLCVWGRPEYEKQRMCEDMKVGKVIEFIGGGEIRGVTGE